MRVSVRAAARLGTITYQRHCRQFCKSSGEEKDR
jgi:hypothetical protein